MLHAHCTNMKVTISTLTLVLSMVTLMIVIVEGQATIDRILRQKYRSMNENLQKAAGLATLIGPVAGEKTVNLLYRLLGHLYQFQQ